MGTEAKTIGFAAVVCLICSLMLSATYSALKPRQDLNKAIDLKSKVLQAFGVTVVDKDSGRKLMTPKQIEDLFTQQVQGFVLASNGKLDENQKVDRLAADDINKRNKTTGLKKFYPYYVYTDAQTGTKLYAIHVSGMGLWSVIKGYIALKDDLATIAGVAIYDHAETPGLGGEIDQPWFQEQFAGKVLVEQQQVRYFRILKPSETEDNASIHGPSGATMTSKGMTEFINKDFKVYHDHFQNLKGV